MGSVNALHANNYSIGLEMVAGLRCNGAINVDKSEFVNCAVGVKMTSSVQFWAWAQLLISRSKIHGTTYAVQSSYNYNLLNSAQRIYPVIHLTDCEIIGTLNAANNSYLTRAIVQNPRGAGAPAEFDHEAWVVNKPAKADLFDVTQAPYNAPFTQQSAKTEFGIASGLPPQDATVAIQLALDDAGANGGGVVYLPAGWYRIDGSLTVPAGVELRGSSSLPARETNGSSHGSVLMLYGGKGTPTPDTDAAAVTLNGDGAGVRGVRFFWPENPFWPEPFAYPYAIRGDGADLYVINVHFANAYKGIDFWTNDCPDHFIRRLVGVSICETIKIGSGAGKIEGSLSNLNNLPRNGYNIPGWVIEGANNGWYPGIPAGGGRPTEPHPLWAIFGYYTRETQVFIYIDGAQNQKLMDNFSFGARHSIYVKSGSAVANTHGADGNTHYAGFQVDPGARLAVINYMAYSRYIVNTSAPNHASAGTPPSNNTMPLSTLANTDTFRFYNYWDRRSAWPNAW